MLFFRVILAVNILVIFSCTRSPNLDSRDYDLYDRLGYEQGKRPETAFDYKRSGVSGNVVPDYYYRVPSIQPQGQIKDNRYNYYSEQQRVNMPSSKQYSNPYAFTPQNFPFYDSDQYYTPPVGFDQSNEGIGPNKFY